MNVQSRQGLGLVGVLICLLAGLCACSATPAAAPSQPTQELSSPNTATPTVEEPMTDESPVPTPGDTLAPADVPPAEVIEKATAPVSPTLPLPDNPALQELVMQAQNDLAQRLGVEVDRIDLVELTPVVWPDGSLGCPEPGMAYTQVQVEGLLIRLRAGKRIYAYHSGGGQPPFLCEQATTGDKP